MRHCVKPVSHNPRKLYPSCCRPVARPMSSFPSTSVSPGQAPHFVKCHQTTFYSVSKYDALILRKRSVDTVSKTISSRISHPKDSRSVGFWVHVVCFIWANMENLISFCRQTYQQRNLKHSHSISLYSVPYNPY